MNISKFIKWIFLCFSILFLMTEINIFAQDSNEARFIAMGQPFPKISGNLIIYGRENAMGVVPDLYLYDLATDTELCIWTPDISAGVLGWDISENVIVWCEEENYRVYTCDVSTGTINLIYDDYYVGDNLPYHPAISDGRIVYVRLRYDAIYEIYMYDVSVETETLICSSPYMKWRPDISGNRIVWQEAANLDPGSWWEFNFNIYMYDLSTGIKTPICTAPGNQWNPAIDGDLIVWQDEADLYMYDLSTGTETAICTAPGAQEFGKISGNLIVWSDGRNGNGDIYMYDLSIGKEIPICTAPEYQLYPDISGNRIVWWSAGGIYLYEYGEANIVGEFVSGNGEAYVNDVQVLNFETFKIRVLDKVRTLSNSYAEIKFGEGTVNLDQNSSFTVDEGSTPDITVLKELYGRLKAKFKKGSTQQFEIWTPVSVSSRRGTEVILEANDYETQVILLEGEMDVSTLDGSQSIILEELQGVIVTADGIGEPFPVNLNEINRWWHRMLISVASPVDLYVTDPLGRHVGCTPTGGIVNEIPGATYTGPSSIPEVIDIPYPVLGSYEIDLTAVGTGPYRLSIAGVGMGDDTFYEEHSGSVEIGEIVSYQSTCEQTEVPINVLIDIKPGSFPNAVYPDNRGLIPVSILTTNNFNAATVDPATVRFGAEGTEAEPVHYALEDVDLDGDIDMIFHFKTQDTEIQYGDTSAHLKGYTFDSREFEGSDSITTVGLNL